MTCSSRVRAESQERSSLFESSVCKLESMSSKMKFKVFPKSLLCYEMARNISDSVTRVTIFGDSDTTRVTLRKIMTRLDSSHSQ